MDDVLVTAGTHNPHIPREHSITVSFDAGDILHPPNVATDNRGQPVSCFFTTAYNKCDPPK